jgi:Ras-related protein Rab-6A
VKILLRHISFNGKGGYTNAALWCFVQALFRKIAAALPGMETLTSTKQEDMVDVNLKASNANSNSQQQAGGCSC